MKLEKFDNIWDALCDDRGEAMELALRSQLMRALSRYLANQGESQVVAAKRLGTTASRLNNLVHGHIDRFTLGWLVTIAGRAGIPVEMRITQ